MPLKPARRCVVGTCPDLAVARGRCAAHLQAQTRVYDHRYGSRIARGYDEAWLKLRARFLRQPGNVACAHCLAVGRVTIAAEVDHIVPFRGLEDPLRLAWTNLQGLCVPCHRRKHAAALMVVR
jgi:5-methylcytosine-specific restriction endonuclease McrA